MKSVAIVLGTYNRLGSLQRAIASIRIAVGAHPYRIVISDGGSSDGTLPYLARCADVHCIDGGLEGAVVAFNRGFAWAVDQGFDYVMHLNDDAEIIAVKPPAIAAAIVLLETYPQIGEVAFEFDLRGDWGFDTVNGAPYANFGVVRREAGIAVAKAQGDPTGRAWWNPLYRTYGADSEFGCRLWQLGWWVYPARGLRVHDLQHQDALRAQNASHNRHGDSDKFWARYNHVDLRRLVSAPVRQILERPATPPPVLAPAAPAPPPPPRRRIRQPSLRRRARGARVLGRGNRGGTCP